MSLDRVPLERAATSSSSASNRPPSATPSTSRCGTTCAGARRARSRPRVCAARCSTPIGDHFTGGLDLPQWAPVFRDGRCAASPTAASIRSARRARADQADRRRGPGHLPHDRHRAPARDRRARRRGLDALRARSRSSAASTRSAARRCASRARSAGPTRCAGCSPATSSTPPRRCASGSCRRSCRTAQQLARALALARDCGAPIAGGCAQRWHPHGSLSRPASTAGIHPHAA